MWNPQHLTTLLASIASYGDSFALLCFTLLHKKKSEYHNNDKYTKIPYMPTYLEADSREVGPTICDFLASIKLAITCK
jgi:hypothetical protein